MKIIALAAAALALATPLFAHAQTTTNDQTVSVAVRYGDLDLARPHQAAVLLDRLGRASMEACGASEFSAREYQAAVRRSDCYRANVQQGVAAVDSPIVTGIYNHRAAQVMVGSR